MRRLPGAARYRLHAGRSACIVGAGPNRSNLPALPLPGLWGLVTFFFFCASLQVNIMLQARSAEGLQGRGLGGVAGAAAAVPALLATLPAARLAPCPLQSLFLLLSIVFWLLCAGVTRPMCARTGGERRARLGLLQRWRPPAAPHCWQLKSLPPAALSAPGWIGLVVAGIAFYGAVAELLNEYYQKARWLGPLPERAGVVWVCGAGTRRAAGQEALEAPWSAAAAAGGGSWHGGPPAAIHSPAHPPCSPQTVLPLGPCKPGSALLPHFQRGVGAIPLLGPWYLR